MTEKNNRLSVLVNTCDKYDDCWYPFFKLFDKYGNELKKLDVYLNTETKQYSYPGININCINSQLDTPWSLRVKNALSAVKSPYVITFLDDFFLREPVKYEVIKKCMEWMDSNPNIGVFYFDPIGKDEYASSEYEGFCLLPPYTPWRCNTQSAIWRKDILMMAMLDIESPWEWEQMGTLRNNTVLKKTEFYALQHHSKTPVEYGLSKISDFGILQGKWHKSDIVPLFESHGIEMDYSIRGFCKENTYEDKTGEPIKKRSILTKLSASISRPIRTFIKNRKILKSSSDADKIYSALVIKPINQWKKRDPEWSHYDYKSESKS